MLGLVNLFTRCSGILIFWYKYSILCTSFDFMVQFIVATIINLLGILKRELKSCGVKYSDVARHLQLSEASVKVMFSKKHFTLERLDKICELIHIDITELVHLFEKEQNIITHLTYDQENELVMDQKCLLVAICVYNRFQFNEIIAQYNISNTECIQYLARLDKLGLIELLPKNHYRLRIADDFRWLPNGPIDLFFNKHVQQEFFKSDFNKLNEFKVYATGMLSNTSHEALLKKLHEIAKEFATLHKNDCSEPLNERHNVGLILASRPWEFSVFKALQRNSK